MLMVITKCVTGSWLNVLSASPGFVRKVMKVVGRKSKNQKNILDRASAEHTSGPNIPGVEPIHRLHHALPPTISFIDKKIERLIFCMQLTDDMLL
jgi:hypothetical protein